MLNITRCLIILLSLWLCNPAYAYDPNDYEYLEMNVFTGNFDATWKESAIEDSMDSVFHRLDSANTPFTAAIQVQTAGGAGGFLLLADGVSYLLLADGVSKLILEGGVSIITIAGASITSDSGAISFGDEDLTTTGSVTVGNLTSSKGRIVNTTRVTTTYQALVSDNVIFANTDSGAYPITMPVGVEGQHIRITNIGANTLTVDGNGTETVMGELTQELSDGDTINLYYNETKGWY